MNNVYMECDVEVLSGNCYLDMLRVANVNWDSSRFGSDALHQGLTNSIKSRLKNSMAFEAILSFGDFMLHLKKDDKYYQNGQQVGLENLSNLLARLLYLHGAGNTDLYKVYVRYSNIPENIRYALENRVPYHFYEDWDRQDVRLNLMQIDSKRYALEISDSVWGEISQKDLDTFINSYRWNKKRGKWHSLSPKKLYTKLMDREPSESEVKLMVAFLKQNRTRDIVEERAKELVSEMCEKYPSKLLYKYFEPNKTYVINGKEKTFTASNNEILFVKGKQFDWKIQRASIDTNTHSRQNVNVYIYNMVSVAQRDSNGNLHVDENGNTIYKSEYTWKGPICIDNAVAGGGNSIGDQMIARALALMNDNIVTKYVSTISSYIAESDMSDKRISFNNIEEYI